MDIQEFITETLNQVTTSVENNLSSLNPTKLKPFEVAELKKYINPVGDGFVTSVEFDVAVTESTSQDGGAKLSIAGLGSLGGDLATGSKTVSRIKFSVPLHIKPSS
mgnify:CR=1 FL=1